MTLKDHARVELYIDTPDTDRNKAIFDFLAQRKAAIEQVFGEPLTWQRLEGKRASRICYYIRNHGCLRDYDRWHELQQSMIGAMIRLEKALRPHLDALPL